MGLMTIRHLEIFITVADCGKMSKAAEILYITQPTVSQAIRELEDYYGARLFERFSRKLFITEEGRHLLSYARYVVDTFREMNRSMKEAGRSWRLRIGASVSPGTCFLETYLRQMEQQMPGIETRVTVCGTHQVEAMVLRSELDMGLVEGTVKSRDIMKIPVCEDRLVIVVGRNHPFYKTAKLDLSCLNGAAYIARAVEEADRDPLEQKLTGEKLRFNKIWSSDNTEAVKHAVAEGRGFAILSEHLVEKELREGSMKVILKERSLNRSIQLIYHKDKFLSEAAKKFIAICT